MSAIYFHQKNQPSYRVEGRERAHLTLLTQNIANALIGATRQFGSRMPGEPTPYGFEVGRFCEMLDRLTVLESDVLNLAARIHGTCELWGWVDGPNRAWLAELIGRARAAGVLRAEMGWEGLQELLRQDASSPVVMSYSVCESFPSRHLYLAGVSVWPANDEEGWYAMSDEQQWDFAMRWMRETAPALDMDVEMKPENWRTWRFATPLSGEQQ